MYGKNPATKSITISSFALFAIFCFALPFCLSNSASAQTLLRWKLKSGESLLVDTQQHTISTVEFIGKSSKTQIDLGMTLRWTVAAADESEIKIKQSVERITFQLAGETSGIVKYDSADKARPMGQAREVADAVKPLVGAEVEITMDGRGQISATQPVNEAAQKLFSDQSTAEMPGVFSRQAIQTLLRQPLVVLPEKAVATDETWTQSSVVKSAAGNFQQTTTYRLVGQEESDGKKLDKIEVSANLTPMIGAGAAPKLTVKAHEQSGTILFFADLGRLISAEQTQKLTTERPYRETTIVVTLQSKQTTTVKPVEP